MYQFLISNANYETLTVISAIILLALISLWIHTKKDQKNGVEEKAKAMVLVAFSEQTCAQTNKTCVLGLQDFS